MGTRQGKGTLGQGWAKTWDKAGTRLGTGLEARLGPWPWGSKFGLEKNFCSSVWKPILSDHAESEGSTAKNEGVGSLCVCWDIVPSLVPTSCPQSCPSLVPRAWPGILTFG